MSAEPGLTTFELLTIIGSVAGGAITLSASFFLGLNGVRKEFWRGFSKMQQWQNRHDRKDDRRFSVLDQRISEITIRNNIKDGRRQPTIKPINEIVSDDTENGENGGEADQVSGF